MLNSHKLLEALKGQPHSTPLISELKGDELGDIIAAIELAEKFDFGALPLEHNKGAPDFAPSSHDIVSFTSEGTQGQYLIPQLTAAEQEMWNEGLIPLPADFCYFEFDFGGSRSALLLSENDHIVSIMRIDFPFKHTDERIRNHIVLDGLTIQVDRRAPYRTTRDGTMEYTMTGPKRLLDILERENKDFVAAQYLSNVPLAQYMLLMLNSRTTEIATEKASPALNKARAKKGRPPLSDHRIVTIVPGRYVDRGDGKGGTHGSPKLHWRRSHIRTTKNGKRVAVVRHLVGKRELGEITHDYVVQIPQR